MKKILLKLCLIAVVFTLTTMMIWPTAADRSVPSPDQIANLKAEPLNPALLSTIPAKYRGLLGVEKKLKFNKKVGRFDKNQISSCDSLNFGPPTLFDVNPSRSPNGPFFVVNGLFNDDAVLDLAVANMLSNTVTIMLGQSDDGGLTGDGTFVRGQVLVMPVGSMPTGLTTDDFDGDLDFDLLVANSGLDNVTPLLSNADGTFTIGTPITTGDQPLFVTSADLDGDLVADDAVTANLAGNSVTVILNVADVTPIVTTVPIAGLGVTPGPRSVVLGDFDNDTDFDLATANSADNTVSVLFNNGAGMFGGTELVVQLNLGPTPELMPFSIDTGDFDGDLDLDLAVANNGSDNVSILLNSNALGLFLPDSIVPVGAGPTFILVDDLNLDTVFDIVTANMDGDSVSVLTGEVDAGGLPDATFSPANNFPTGPLGSGPTSLVLGLYDEDAILDLAVSNMISDDIAILLGFCCPAFTFNPIGPALPDAQIGVSYSGVSVTATGGTAPFTYMVSSGSLPTGLTLNSTTGAITGTPSGPQGLFSFEISALDANQCQDTNDYTIMVVCPTITFSPLTLPDGTIGVAYSQTITATGGTGTFTYMVSAGTLPNGLTLDSMTGVISGTPMQPTGAFPFTITATSTDGCIGMMDYTINIVCPVITFSPLTLPNATIGVAYSQTITATGGTGTFTYMVSAGTLPNGLTLDSMTGVISGTPMQPTGAFPFTITATSTDGCVAMMDYSITVVCAQVSVSSSVAYAALCVGGISNLYTINLGTGAATFIGVIGPAGSPVVPAAAVTPDGNIIFGINANNSLISFRPTAPGVLLSNAFITGLQTGETILGIDFRPATGVLFGLGSTSRIYTIDTATAIATQVGTGPFTPLLSGTTFGFDFNPVPDRIRVNSDAEQNLRINPDTGAVAVVDGNLNPAGNVAGAAYTNSFAGTTTTTLYDIDSAADTLLIQNPPNDGTLVTVGSLTVDTAPVVGFDISNPLTIPNAQVDVAYSATLTGTGGSGPYTFTVISNTLPAGITFDSITGVISGTPNTAGSGSLTVTVTDANGCISPQQTYTLTVDCPPLRLATATGLAALQVSGSASSTLYSINLTTGAATSLGQIGTGLVVRDITLSLGTTSSTIFGLTSPNNLVTFSRTAPGTILSTTPITGLVDTLVGIDFRPASGQLYGIGSTSRVYVINTTTGVATLVGSTAFTPALIGANFGVDFNPVPDRIRVVSDANQNLRLNPETGAHVPPPLDGNLNPGDPNVVGVAYTNSFANAPSTTLYDIDTITDQLFIQNPPNAGTLVLVGNLGVDISSDAVGFDISNTVLPNGLPGVAYSQTISAFGSTGPFTFSVTAGTLPTGITLSSSSATTALLSGTTLQTGTFNFTITASLANGCMVSQAYSLMFGCPVITVNPTTLPNAVNGTPYSQTFTAVGGTGPYTFSVSAGSLPTGLSLNSITGVLSGTPTAVGTFNFTITATDANGCMGSRAYVFTTQCEVYQLSAIISSAKVNRPYGTNGAGSTVNTIGGVGPFTFAVVTGALPNGLTLNTSTGLISGTPRTIRNFAFTIRATDSRGCMATRNYNINVTR